MLKINNKFLPLITDSDSRYFIITGGRGSSKSYITTSVSTALTFERNHTILFTRYTMTSAHLSIIPEFLEKIQLYDSEKFFTINKADITNNLTGSKVLFRGIKTSSGNQTAALKSLQGVTTWVLDEAEELVSEKIFDDIDLSVRHKGTQNRIILVLNPTTKEHWIYQKFFERRGVQEGFNGVKNNIRYIHTTYLDNVDNLSDSYIDSIELMKLRRPEKYKHIILGGWLAKAEGVIFSNWSMGDYDDSVISIFGQDYGFSVDATTLIKVGIDKKARKIYIDECFYKHGLTTTEIYNLSNDYAGSKLIVGDSAEPRLIHEVRNKGCNLIAVKKGKDSIIAGLSIMLDYDLVITQDSINVIKELNNYVWSDKKSQTPIDNYNHCIDAIRYVVFHQLNKSAGVYALA